MSAVTKRKKKLLEAMQPLDALERAAKLVDKWNQAAETMYEGSASRARLVLCA